MRGTLTQEMFYDIPEIDFRTGYKYFLGNLDNYTNALMSTLKSIKSKLPLLQLMSKTEEYEGLRTITQTLRKMFDNIGAVELGEKAYQLETVLLNQDMSKVKEQLKKFSTDMSILSKQLETLLKSVDSSHNEKKDSKEASFLNRDFSKTKESIKLSSNYLGRKII